MAGAPTFEVLARYRDRLAGMMPTQPQHDAIVPVFYSHPGDQWAGSALLWFDQVEEDFEIHSMRADKRRRLTHPRFFIVAAVALEGPTDPANAADLQLQADRFAASLRDIVDEDIALEEHLGCPDLIDVAKVVRCTTERGMFATGAGTRITITIEFDARHL